MLIKQYPYIDEQGISHSDLIYHFSDAGKYIEQIETGWKYISAVDAYPCKYTYRETNEAFPVYEEEGDIK